MKKYFYDECAIEYREYGTIERRDRLLVKCDEHRARGAVHPVRPGLGDCALIFVTLYDKKEVIDD